MCCSTSQPPQLTCRNAQCPPVSHISSWQATGTCPACGTITTAPLSPHWGTQHTPHCSTQAGHLKHAAVRSTSIRHSCTLTPGLQPCCTCTLPTPLAHQQPSPFPALRCSSTLPRCPASSGARARAGSGAGAGTGTGAGAEASCAVPRSAPSPGALMPGQAAQRSLAPLRYQPRALRSAPAGMGPERQRRSPAAGHRERGSAGHREQGRRGAGPRGAVLPEPWPAKPPPAA